MGTNGPIGIKGERMARLTPRQRELHRFLQDGQPSALATFLSEHPQAAVSFLGLHDAGQLRDFNQLLKSDANDDVQYAFDRIDQALRKRVNLLALFEDGEESKAEQPPKERKKQAPAPGSAKAEFKENITLAAFSAGRLLRSLATVQPREIFHDAVRLLTESIAAGLSLAGLNKKWRHITGLTAGGTTFAALSVKAAAPITGAIMSFAAATGDAEAALPQQPDIYRDGQAIRSIIHEFEKDASSALSTSFNRPLEITVTRDGPRVQSPFRMMPELERHIARDPQAAQYVAWLHEAAAACGIDGNLFANQIYKESFWFKPEVITGQQKSPKGAVGIAQFMPDTAKGLGVDPLNPREAIFTAAQHMCNLTKKYGDQQLAMVVYNGREDALQFAAEELGISLSEVNIQRWIDFMQKRREIEGTEAKHAWHVETLGYIEQTSITANGPQFARIPAVAAIGNLILPAKDIPTPLTRPRNL